MDILNKFSSVCVFCGSASGNRPHFVKAAKSCGEALAEREVKLVYGGGKVGLMGAIADAVLSSSGRVAGVMPRHLVEREIAHESLTELVIVETMHERKTKMSEMAGAFIVLPGGAGTLEEAFEQWTWAQLAIHEKPIGFLNVEGYFNPLLHMIDGMVDAGFLAANFRDMLIIENEATALLDRFGSYTAPERKSYETQLPKSMI